MTHEEAVKKAQEIVWVYFTMPDIVYHCELREIPTRTKSGKLRNRTALETALIEAMTKEFESK